MADRNALLNQIQQGKRLKKAETNDRSAPKVGNSSGGGGPPMGGMALPRPPMPPSGGGSSHSPAESRGPPSGMPGIGGLFAGGIPKLKHRTGGIKTGRGSEDNSNGGGQNPVPATSIGSGAAKESGGGGSRFQLPFRKNSHSSNNTAKAPPPPPIPAARPPPVPPSSTPPSRPGSSFSAKKAPPPPPPSSKKPQIKPKPAGLGKGRMSSPTQLSPSPAAGSMPNLRGGLRHVNEVSRTQSPATPSQENDRPNSSLYDGSEVIEESQGSVSSLAGRFGASVRNKAPPRPPAATSSNLFGGHQRTSSGSAPSQPPPPPPPIPPSVPQRSSANNGVREGGGNVPVREGKWTFHSLPELPPPPSSMRSGSTGKPKYPSGNSTGSSIALNI